MMMSDHWKKLANLLGTPGPADPPETEQTPAANAPPAATEAAVHRPRPDAAPDAQPSAAQSSRKRTSMWGDDPETAGEATSADLPQQAAAQPSPPPPRRSGSSPQASQAAEAETAPAERGKQSLETAADEPPVDALVAIVAVKREPPVPGFDVPESQSPERAQTPAKRSAWDTLIGTLGIKPAAEAEEQPPQAAAPAKEAPKREVREPAETGGFGAGLVEGEERPRRSSERTAREGVARGPSPEPRAERPAETAEDRPADADEERPRGRGRRGGSRIRSRADQREPDTTASSDIGWDPEPVPSDAPRRASAEPTDLDRPRRSDDRSAGGVGGKAPGGDEGEGDARRRRPRRRGQRQSLSTADSESGRSATEPTRSRSDSGSRPGDEADAPRRDDARGRERRSRGDRVEETRSAPASRSGRQEESRRGEPRAERRRRPEADEPVDSGEDVSEGFGGNLLAESAPTTSDQEDVPTRPRRRRGRRGRGGAAPREEDTQRSEEVGEPEDTWAPVSEAPGFDDDYEDDDEAEQIRRRSRGARARTTRRDVEPRDRGDEPQLAAEPPARSRAREEPPKHYSAPTWLDTVTLLVDANVQRRASGGGGSSRGSQGGRGGRR